MNLRLHSTLFLFATLSASLLLTACNSREAKSQTAVNQYQTAVAQGDVQAIRKALLALVAADDTQAQYWVELGKVQVQLGDLGAAFNAFQRAYELNRADPAVLGFLTQIALRGGQLDQAEKYARELELVNASDPAVPLTYGYVALRRGDLAEADKQAGLILAANSFDPSGKVLRSRVRLQEGKPDEAVALLREQVQAQPSDQLSLRALLGLYEYREQWADAGSTARLLLNWVPKDQDVRGRLILAEIRAGRPQAALPDLKAGLSQASSQEATALLNPWLLTGQADLALPVAVRAGEEAPLEKKVAIANFILRAGKPKLVADMLEGSATEPVTATNINANALYATAIGMLGQAGPAVQLLNEALALDGANVKALRGRAMLRSRAGQHQGAIEDAQKFVAADRASSEARLLLANTYVAAGQPDAAKRTLWDGFHDIPADRSIYQALQSFVQRMDGPSAAQSLREEYNDQRNDAMIRSFA
ncbi:tetratricopeptide repeat protein [Sphingomonas sp. KRR8]|uniref:tetratricopeptide repeat protein n=1 Tax=Sphingomonas sp. KRR8 TaxID=2942996 RepID=UPI0020226CF9|nr:tetratricopeptide repeat protein [Sphingomonas sp. KRR8]URD61536.1 tetratricopeptide repeat protein [Sphingomonas sp. KRR8]